MYVQAERLKIIAAPHVAGLSTPRSLKEEFMEDKSGFVIVYMAVAISGGIMGLFLGWIIWG